LAVERTQLLQRTDQAARSAVLSTAQSCAKNYTSNNIYTYINVYLSLQSPYFSYTTHIHSAFRRA